MKKCVVQSLVGLVAILCLFTSLRPAWADEVNDEQKASGTLLSVNEKDRTVAIEGIFFQKSYNLADNCRIIIPDKTETKISDLRPGHRVEINYRSIDGVLVVNRLRQDNLVMIGSVETIQLDKRTLALSVGTRVRVFNIADTCRFFARGKEQGKLEDLKPNQKINVSYEVERENLVAYKIELRSERFSGLLDAVDVTSRTVKAKYLMTTKRFNLAEDCEIIINGRKGGKLTELKLGSGVEINYENIDGVYVAQRIVQGDNAASP